VPKIKQFILIYKTLLSWRDCPAGHVVYIDAYIETDGRLRGRYARSGIKKGETSEKRAQE